MPKPISTSRSKPKPKRATPVLSTPVVGKDPYWICRRCARKRGGTVPRGHVCTSAIMDCRYCGTKSAYTTPIVDFNWPDKNYAEFRD